MLNQYLDRYDSPIIVAHSLGAYLTLKYITTKQSELSLRGLFLIAPPFPSGDKNWEFEGFELPPNFTEKIQSSFKVYLYHSLDDKIVPYEHSKMYVDAIPNVIFRETSGGHNLDNNLKIIAEDIKKLL